MRKTLIPLFFLLVPAAIFGESQLGVVQVPVTDVRSASGSIATSLNYDPQEETQLLYGEPVQILGQSGEWLKIEAIEQKEYTHAQIWTGYPGWVQKSAIRSVKNILPSTLVVKNKTAGLYKKPSQKNPYLILSMGTKLQSVQGEGKNDFWKVRTSQGESAWVKKSDVRLAISLPENLARKFIIESGMKLLSDPYFWGGRSAHYELPNQVTAVDCSGLVNLAYRVAGLDIPRDSHEQYMAAKKITRGELQMGDLIFSASKEKPDKVTHVAIYIDSSTILEAPKTGEVVHTLNFDQKYGPDSVIYFGTYFGQN